jgi:hypothetical protein
MSKSSKALDAGKLIIAKLNQAKATEVAELKNQQKLDLVAFREKQRFAIQELREKQQGELDKMIQDFFNNYEGSKGDLVLETGKPTSKK